MLAVAKRRLLRRPIISAPGTGPGESAFFLVRFCWMSSAQVYWGARWARILAAKKNFTAALAWRSRYTKEFYRFARLEGIASILPPDWQNAGCYGGVLRAGIINQDPSRAGASCEFVDSVDPSERRPASLATSSDGSSPPDEHVPPEARHCGSGSASFGGESKSAPMTE